MEFDKRMEEAHRLLSDGYTMDAANRFASLGEEALKNGDLDTAESLIVKAFVLFKKESAFYKASSLLFKAGTIYKKKENWLEAGRQFSRSGNLFRDVKAYGEAAKSFVSAGDMFMRLKGEFFIEAGKHYKMAIISLIYDTQHQAAEYMDALDKAERSFKAGYEAGETTRWNYYLYLENLYLDTQDALDRNGLNRESSEIYLKRMHASTNRAALKREDWGRHFSMVIWNWTSGYGEKPWRWVAWIFILQLLFSNIYYFTGAIRTASGGGLSYFETIYFAFNIFATLGFGTYELVSKVSYTLIMLNVFMGYLMMAVLITIIARRFTK
jgi:hypothetical protein